MTTTAQKPTNINLSIQDLKYTSNIKDPLKFYVKFELDGKIQQTTQSARKHTPAATWAERLSFNGSEMSILKVKVYAKHRLHRDEYAGGAEISVEALSSQAGHVVLRLNASLGDPDAKFKKDELGNVEFTVTFESTSRFGEIITTVQAQVDGMHLVPFELFLNKTEGFINVISVVSELHPYAKVAWGVLSVGYHALLEQKAQDDDVKGLLEYLGHIFLFLQESDAFQKLKTSSYDTSTKTVEHQINVLKLILQQATECGYFIESYAKNSNAWSRVVKNLGNNVQKQIKEYKDKLTELKSAFQDFALLQIEISALKFLGGANTTTVQVDLSQMQYSKGATYNPEKACLPNTRQAIIEEIIEWINSPADDVAHLFWLTGVAGSGKSAIAHSVAARLYEQNRLGSSYAFDISKADRTPEHLFSTITCDLAGLDGHWKMSLWNVIKDTPSLCSDPSVQRQFDNFLLKPARRLGISGPLLIVIDALDECGTPQSRRALLSILAQRIQELPRNIRILLTSRPEQDIYNALQGKKHIYYKSMESIDVNSTNYDISEYIRYQVSDIESLETRWPNKQWCTLMVEKSEGLFQWASTACLFIKEIGCLPSDQLEVLLSAADNTLDSLYTTILNKVFNVQNERSMSRMRIVLGNVLALKEPLCSPALVGLLTEGDKAKLKPEDIKVVLKPLGAVLSGVNDHSAPIKALHASFQEYLMESARSNQFCVNIAFENKHILECCFEVMKKQLNFNMCNLETSHVANVDVKDLEQRIEENIPDHLIYACKYWSNHLQDLLFELDISQAVKDFMTTRLLYWIETLSLIDHMRGVHYSLSVVEKWIENHDQDIAKLAKDGQKFLATFYSAIARSAPHAYISALPFAPEGSKMSEYYIGKLSKTIKVTGNRVKYWPAIEYVLEGHTASVTSVGFSPGGKHIVSGSWDNTIRVWDADTGNPMLGPLQGHTDTVTSVEFSSDGKYIVSGSYDKTIRVWDAGTGNPVAGPFHGHTNYINSVGFSPDGKYIVSGSRDKTIRMWDANTGNAMAEPFQGHIGYVNSVRFSPNGKYIVSGSYNNTISIWDTNTGNLVAGPFQGHTSHVTSVEFSPDGRHIVSGSWDNTIRVWDADTGNSVAGPFQGHTDVVSSVRFSVDGKHIVSGSRDNKIIVWDVGTGNPVAELFQGHIGLGVSSVEFSPDGKHIVSGSYDNMIRVWDANTSNPMAELVEGHTYSVSSVGFAPDSKYIVSGSKDRTIRVWDTDTGKPIAGPFQGHTNDVNAVGFLSDGRHIISGSRDSTIRVWDIATGNTVVGPFQGHTDAVTSVECSPDGKYIVSGSRDNTIRVWDASTGSTVAGPFQGHTDHVNSVGFSPDGKYIVSGSKDNTIRVWNIGTGNSVADLFQGHTNVVASVKFSSDGKYIVSGSYDGTIRVWDANTGNPMLGPFQGHTNAVTSVGFSSDGKHIVSGSWDNTIRIWDAHTGNPIAEPFHGHTDYINSVEFSSDGKYIVSGSYDKTVRVWDINTAAKLFQDHTSDRNHIVSWSNDHKSLIQSSSTNGLSRLTHIYTMENGWLLGPNRELLLWAPPYNHINLTWDLDTLVIGEHTKIDISHFIHGISWTQCQ